MQNTAKQITTLLVGESSEPPGSKGYEHRLLVLREQAYLGPVCLQKDPTKVYKQMRGQTIFVMNGRISV